MSLSFLHPPLSISVSLHQPCETQDCIYCGCSIKAEAKVHLNSVHCWSLPTITGHHWHHWHLWYNSNIHSGMNLTVYSISYSMNTMTCSTLTSFHTSRQPSRQPSKQPLSVRLSPVLEPPPSQIPESIIDPDEANNLMLPAHQQASPPTQTSHLTPTPSLLTVDNLMAQIW